MFSQISMHANMSMQSSSTHLQQSQFAHRRASVAGTTATHATRNSPGTPPRASSTTNPHPKARPSSMILLPRATTPGSHPASSSSTPPLASNTLPLNVNGGSKSPGLGMIGGSRMARSATASSIGSTASTSLLAAAAAASTVSSAQDDTCGVTVRKTKLFLRRRKTFTERLHLESNRLQTRLRKLLDLGRNPSLTLAQLKLAEQAIVPWEPDTHVLACRQCNSTFSFFNRKHHCRLCGRVVCGSCSVKDAYEETLLIRLCVACVDTLGVATRGADKGEKGALVLAYEQLAGLRREIEDGVPKLKELISKLEALGDVPSDHPMARRIRTLATTYKKDLDTHFASITQICQKLSLYNPQSTTESKLKLALVRAHTDLVQSLMSTVNSAADSLSRSAKRTTPATSLSAASTASSSSAPGAPSQPTDTDTDTEEYLHTLIEQYTQLEYFLKEATEQRQLETVRTLKVSLDEIVAEVRRVEVKLYGESRFRPA
ncbi:hypothetical protein BCR44DRAFT_1437898 [Catenaria anguillulae PL171]|uniref:FYVE-type domain-containing protein n=1 Tax=Catenaria anguillulae PL171 TaxID=765915 RepID=A0A1Y2HIY1_9FUNG|nr:hypothetical protein BCR44DRAFT_1437898 [Catenaria anguillulae PL171]